MLRWVATKLYLVGGAPRVGKSSLARRLLRNRDVDFRPVGPVTGSPPPCGSRVLLASDGATSATVVLEQSAAVAPAGVWSHHGDRDPGGNDLLAAHGDGVAVGQAIRNAIAGLRH
jgi:hypothetical protein